MYKPFITDKIYDCLSFNEILRILKYDKKILREKCKEIIEKGYTNKKEIRKEIRKELWKEIEKGINSLTPFKIGGLIFACKEDYKCFKYFDSRIEKIYDSLELDGHMTKKAEEVWQKEIVVKEEEYGSSYELGELFPNADSLLIDFDNDIIDNFDDFAVDFFRRITIIECGNFGRKIKKERRLKTYKGII